MKTFSLFDCSFTGTPYMGEWNSGINFAPGGRPLARPVALQLIKLWLPLFIEEYQNYI